MRAIPILGVVLLSLGFVAPANADHRSECPDAYTDSTNVFGAAAIHSNERGQLRVDADDGERKFYLASDAPYADFDALRDPVFSIWLYEETNGQPGLQRNDDVCHDSGDGPGDAFLQS